MKKQKMMTIQQLAKFCEENKLYHFDSNETGHRIYVQVPDIMEFSNTEDDDFLKEGLMFCPVRVCHILDNLNGSFISENDMKKALPSLAYRPLLGAIHQLDDGTYDFHSHDMELVENEDGEYEYEYIESQIGAFTVDKPKLVYDKEYDKTYVEAIVAIPEEYSKAAEIIMRKGGTKVSCELAVDKMSYDSKNKWLVLEDFYFSGVTCLGSEKDGTPINEGMKGSRLKLEDFSHSLFSHVDKKLIETLEKLNATLSNFNIDSSQEKGGESVFDKLLKKYKLKLEDVTFDYENLTDEELEAKFEEAFGANFDDELGDLTVEDEEEELVGAPEGAVEGEDEGKNPLEEGDGQDDDEDDDDDEGEEVIPDAPVLESQTETTITVTTIEDQEYSIDNGATWQDSGEFSDLEPGTEYTIITRIKAGEDTDPSVNSKGLLATTNVDPSVIADEGAKGKKKNNSLIPEKYSITMSDGSIREFALSLQDQISALTILVNDTYGETDNCWYDVLVYDKNVVMSDWWTGKAYRQDYKVRSGVYSLIGDRVPVHSIYVTDDEEKEFENMKSKFSAVSDELEKYHAEEEKAKKSELMKSDAYKSIFDKQEFKDTNIDEFDVDGLTKHLDDILLKYAKEGNLTFAETKKTKETKKLFGDTSKNKKKGRYGNLFKKK